MILWDLQKYGDLRAVITDQGECFSYHDLDRMQEEFFSNIQPGSLIFIFAENDMSSLTAYLSCLIHQVVSVMMPADNVQSVNGFLLSEYQPEFIWIIFSKYEKYKKGFIGYKEIFSSFGYVLLERIRWGGRKLHPDLALLLPTSGSMGNPRLVRLSAHNILTNTISICDYMKITKNDRAVTSLPLGYTYGLSLIHTLLYSGGSIFLTKESIVRSTFWRHMEEYDVTIFSGVPYTYECMKKLNINIAHLKKLRMLTQAGGKLSEELQRYRAF